MAPNPSKSKLIYARAHDLPSLLVGLGGAAPNVVFTLLGLGTTFSIFFSVS
jgi:hypothetical protein